MHTRTTDVLPVYATNRGSVAKKEEKILTDQRRSKTSSQKPNKIMKQVEVMAALYYNNRRNN